MDTEPLVFVGIDWASTEHQVCLTGADNPVQRTFAHDAGGIGAMVDWLCDQAEQPDQVRHQPQELDGANARNAIITRLTTKYGPLPHGYTPEGIWLGAAVGYDECNPRRLRVGNIRTTSRAALSSRRPRYTA